MPITPRQLDIKGALIQDAYEALEEEIMKQLIDRLNSKTVSELSEDTVFQWQIEKLQQLGLLDMQTIEELVKETSAYSKKILQEIILDDGYEIGQEANQEFANLMDTDVKSWSNLDAILNQYFDSQWLDFDNHVNQTLITTNFGDSWIAKSYQQVLNDTVAKVVGGLVTPDKAFRTAIYDLVDQGITSGFKDKAGREWSLERYVRSVITATKNHVYNDLRLSRSKDYGIVTALMSSKAAAREACALIQGGWVLTVPKAQAPDEFRQYPSIYDFGYGTAGGTQGIHCHHRLYPGIPGITKNNMPKPPTAEQAKQNAEIVAKQRRLEASIRQAKKHLNASKAMGDDENAEHFSKLIRQRQSALRQFISDNSSLLHRDYSREQVYS